MVVLLYHLKDVLSIVLSKKITLLILEYHLVTRTKVGRLIKFAQVCQNIEILVSKKEYEDQIWHANGMERTKNQRGSLLLLPRKCQRIQQEKQATLAIPKHTFCYATDSS